MLAVKRVHYFLLGDAGKPNTPLYNWPQGVLLMIGGRLRQLREAKGLRQEDIARVAGVTPEAIGMYENDRREPKGEILRAIASYLGTSTDYLLGLADDPTAPGAKPKPAGQPTDTEFRAFLRGRKLSDKDIELILQLEERMRRESEEKKKGQE